MFFLIVLRFHFGITFLLLLQLNRSQNRDSLLPLLHLPVKLLLPGAVPGNQRGIRLLHGDQNRVVKAVMMKLGHGIQILLVLLRREQILDSFFELFQNRLYLLPPCLIRFITQSRTSFLFYPKRKTPVRSVSHRRYVLQNKSVLKNQSCYFPQ